MCLTGSLVTSWFLTQEVAGSCPFTVMTNKSLNLGKTPLWDYLQFIGGSPLAIVYCICSFQQTRQ